MGVEKRSVATLRQHPCAGLVPELRTDEWAAVLADVRERGIDEPLAITAAGVVLDGRHRLRAAREVGRAHVPIRVVAPEDEVEYIVAQAVNRRHLTDGQRAAVVVALQSFQQARRHAADRQRANLRGRSSEVATLPPRSGRTREQAAKLADVGSRTMQKVITVHDNDPELFEQILAGTLTPAAAWRELERKRRYTSITPAPPLPAGPFELVYADPPWQLGNPQSAYAPEQYYPTMALDDICAMQVPAADDALLYLWAVNSHLPDALAVMQAWGFSYRGCEVWVKPSIGMGVWTRNRHELLLIGSRGNASPAARTLLLDSVIEAPRGRHSEKPPVVYERLEPPYPEPSKVELVARGTPRPGWTAWGNQLDQPQADSEAEAA